MVRVALPPLDPRLREPLEVPIRTGVLNNDAVWENSLLPLLLERLEAVKEAVHQAQTINANGPSGKEVDIIDKSCNKIKNYLGQNFADAAPFTIYRIAELVLEPEKSGYSLSTVQSIERYLAAFARTVMVVTKETEHFEDVEPDVAKETNGFHGAKDEAEADMAKATPEEYEKFDLPRDVKFLSIPWALSSEPTSELSTDKLEHTEDTSLSPPAKRQKAENGEGGDSSSIFEETNVTADSKK